MSKFYNEDKDVLLVNEERVESSDSSKTFAQLLLLIAYLLTVALICLVFKFTKITVLKYSIDVGLSLDLSMRMRKNFRKGICMRGFV